MTGKDNKQRPSADDSDSEPMLPLVVQPTVEYVVPSEKFKTEKEVFRLRGYDKDSMVRIAEGGQSQVFRVTKITDRQEVAVKEINLRSEEEIMKVDEKKRMKIEIQIIAGVRHKNIIRLIDHFMINNTCYLFMELANGGTVEDVIPLNETVAKQFFLQMAIAVDHLHSLRVSHNDLKLNNILIHKIAKEMVLKVTDFGFSQIVSRKSRLDKPKGTLPYMSPQLFNLIFHENIVTEPLKSELKADRQYKPKTVNPLKADIWALGVCLYRMVSGQYPFDVPDHGKWMEAMEVVKEMLNNRRKPIETSAQLKDLMDQMLEPETKYRIDIKAVLNHKWLKGVSQVIPIE